MRRVSRHLVIALAAAAAGLAVCESAPAASGCEVRLLTDWRDGRIDRTYPIACYERALADMPEDLRIYSSAESDIKRALQARVRNGAAAASTTDSRDSGTSLWLVVGITAAILAAASLVAFAR